MTTIQKNPDKPASDGHNQTLDSPLEQLSPPAVFKYLYQPLSLPAGFKKLGLVVEFVRRAEDACYPQGFLQRTAAIPADSTATILTSLTKSSGTLLYLCLLETTDTRLGLFLNQVLDYLKPPGLTEARGTASELQKLNTSYSLGRGAIDRVAREKVAEAVKILNTAIHKNHELGCQLVNLLGADCGRSFPGVNELDTALQGPLPMVVAMHRHGLLEALTMRDDFAFNLRCKPNSTSRLVYSCFNTDYAPTVELLLNVLPTLYLDDERQTVLSVLSGDSLSSAPITDDARSRLGEHLLSTMRNVGRPSRERLLAALVLRGSLKSETPVMRRLEQLFDSRFSRLNYYLTHGDGSNTATFEDKFYRLLSLPLGVGGSFQPVTDLRILSAVALAGSASLKSPEATNYINSFNRFPNPVGTKGSISCELAFRSKQFEVICKEPLNSSNVNKTS